MAKNIAYPGGGPIGHWLILAFALIYIPIIFFITSKSYNPYLFIPIGLGLLALARWIVLGLRFNKWYNQRYTK